jgi:hypothetical protein
MMIGGWVRAATLSGASFLLPVSAGCGSGGGSDSAPSEQHAKPTNIITSSGPDGYMRDYGLSCTSRVSGDDLVVKVQNDTANDVRIFGWNTPWDKNADAFRVVNPNTLEVIDYTGPILNRERDETSDIVVPAYGDATGIYPIAKWYPVRDGDVVDIALASSTFELTINGQVVNVAHDCGSAHLHRQTTESGESTQALLEPYPSCTETQKAEINRAIDGAMRAVTLATRAFDDGNSVARDRWFGNQSLSPRAAYSRMLVEDELVRCGSDGSPCSDHLGVVMDYFFDNKLYLCAPVWSKPYASTEGWEQQVGVLVHELAHLVDQPDGSIEDFQNPNCSYRVDCPFYDLSCDPKCYGVPDSLYLASCPDCAQRNADNYKYFAMQFFMQGAMTAAIF